AGGAAAGAGAAGAGGAAGACGQLYDMCGDIGDPPCCPTQNTMQSGLPVGSPLGCLFGMCDAIGAGAP
ncbi:MAG: hypothetical protein CME61_07085, partial [Halobacteriovoraceae bacterium]|nr:hypothetical protein [Halobacteriovoraceae bacterium]